MAEKLDYQPGVFTVERHIRGKWVCANCETLIQAPVPARVIDKGLPTAGLLEQVLVPEGSATIKAIDQPESLGALTRPSMTDLAR